MHYGARKGLQKTAAALLDLDAEVNVHDGVSDICLCVCVYTCVCVYVCVCVCCFWMHPDDNNTHLFVVMCAQDSGRTPLHEAATGDHVSTVRLLLSRGARVNSRDKVSTSNMLLPFFSVIFCGHSSAYACTCME